MIHKNYKSSKMLIILWSRDKSFYSFPNIFQPIKNKNTIMMYVPSANKQQLEFMSTANLLGEQVILLNMFDGRKENKEKS